MNAVGYIRCAASDTTGAVLEQMENEIRQYCNTQHITLKEVFRDNGVGGLDFDRAGWKEMLQYLKEEKESVKGLVVMGFDRIGRNVANLLKEIRKLENEFGLKILEVTSNESRILKHLTNVNRDNSKGVVGRTVIVHPHLTTDPADRRGQIGTIKSMVGSSAAYVDFENGSTAAYELNGLLTLQPKKTILDLLVRNDFSGEEVRSITKIYVFALQRKYREAIDIAVGNERIAKYCLWDCQTRLEHHIDRKAKKASNRRLK